MAYQTLYREWRPTTLADVVGQEHVKRTLTNMLKAGRVPHALLFAGPRGTGKTSVAKIFARAVNCEVGITPEPCLACSSCVGIGQNTSLDVFEIDAASNRGIDEIRELRENVKYAPSKSRYKVYIIDEVHMLTPEAFNALLKTLEEPPSHVLFVLATTEPHKLPATIISRCQRFDFRRIQAEAIGERISQVATAKGVEIAIPARRLISIQAGGAMRDALGILEQCIAHIGQGGRIDLEHVENVTGRVPTETFLRLLEALTKGDLAVVLAELNEEILRGREAQQLLSSYIATLRLLLLAAHSPPLLVDLGYEPVQVASFATIAKAMGSSIAPVIESALTTESELRYGAHQQLSLEVMFLKQSGIMTGKTGSLPAREEPVTNESSPERPENITRKKPVPVKQTEVELLPVSTTASGSVALLLRAWPDVLKIVKQKAPLTGATLGAVTPLRMEGNIVILQMKDNNVHTFKRLNAASELEQVALAFAKVLNMAVEVQIKMPGSEPNTAPLQHEEQIKQVLEIFQGTIVEDN
ncbi:MAG: DNA polymerase III subunit tau [Firmicutes bacterium]|nr:DNA polymerase III subunit tau [Bacillota bacterium]